MSHICTFITKLLNFACAWQQEPSLVYFLSNKISNFYCVELIIKVTTFK